ncbi:hypothetical protein GCM10010302_30850 [Streptomyces polychromogenes]|uniref:Uncharacterized protein n=1 Tax=Streptomyces polychromogenes TaxID=67342 RepID=A0ABP3F0Z1_9ACTN
MGSPITIFRLFRHEPCGRELLVRVERPAASNADQGALDAADRIADVAAERLRAWWQQRHLRPVCAHPHTSGVIAEMQEDPVGPDLFGDGHRTLALWVAQTKYGAPWAVFGTAASEAEFWQQVRLDDCLLGLGPLAPGELHHVDFLTDRDAPTLTRP